MHYIWRGRKALRVPRPITDATGKVLGVEHHDIQPGETFEASANAQKAFADLMEPVGASLAMDRHEADAGNPLQEDAPSPRRGRPPGA